MRIFSSCLFDYLIYFAVAMGCGSTVDGNAGGEVRSGNRVLDLADAAAKAAALVGAERNDLLAGEIR